MSFRIKLPAFLATAVILSAAATVFANATPIYIESFPAFNIAPAADTPIAVDREELTFKVDRYSSEHALVTATYTLSNRSGEKISVPMVFPFFSEGYSGLEAKLEFNGKAVAYEVFGAGSLYVLDYLKEPEKFSQQVDIETIIENLNQPFYQAKYFDDSGDTVLYRVTYRELADRERLSLHFDPEKTRIIISGISGTKINNRSGECVLSTSVRDDASYILVLGEETLQNIKLDHDIIIEQSIVNLREFFMSSILAQGEYPANRNTDNLYDMIVREIDRRFEHDTILFHTDDIIYSVVYGYGAISVLFYEVEFEAGSTNTLTVTYPLQATIDRERSDDYVNTFAYILNPARNFADFGGIDIRIELNEYAPYIIQSSIPLAEFAAGVFGVSLDGLPNQDLVFSTYPQAEVSHSLINRLFPHGYGMLLFLIQVIVMVIILAALLGTAVYLCFRKTAP